ncbi:MAG: hypothetical protein HYV75_10505 [Opitutae bacterium]|nr:hypothetical protein [Opitutae bacterium]
MLAWLRLPAAGFHQLEAGATFYIIADNPLIDTYYYPDSKKWGLRRPRTIFRLTEVDYFDGGE